MWSVQLEQKQIHKSDTHIGLWVKLRKFSEKITPLSPLRPYERKRKITGNKRLKPPSDTAIKQEQLTGTVIPRG